MKNIWRIFAPISVILTLATWLFFAYSRATDASPLSASETTFVFAFWFAVTAGASSGWKCYRKNSKKRREQERRPVQHPRRKAS